MKCQRCQKDKCLWTELYKVTLYKDKDGKPVKAELCTTCLGWDKKKLS